MLSLASMLDKWVTKNSNQQAARRVAVTGTRLRVEFMQQDKFQQVTNYIEMNKYLHQFIHVIQQ